MPEIVRLFVLNEQDERVGVFVLDMEALNQMYQERLQHSDITPPTNQDWDAALSQSEDNLPPSMLYWKWSRDEEGNICLRFKPKEP